MPWGKWKWTRRLCVRSRCLREFMAETLGTFVLVAFGVGAGCQFKLGSPGTDQMTAHLAGAMGVMLAISISGGVSGGGVNPAVSLTFCLTNRTPWILYPIHVIGQLIGAFLAAGIIFCVYKDAIDHFDHGVRSVDGATGTAAMFTSFPQAYLSTGGGFLDQVVGTGLLILCINAILDKYNMDAPKGLKPLLVGLCVFAIGGTLGLNCGYPINPARDLGPRLFLWAAGWGKDVFSYDDYNWFWVPILGPLTGSLVGTLVYYLFIGWHWTDQQRGGGYNLGEDMMGVTRAPGDSTRDTGHENGGTNNIHGVSNAGFTTTDASCNLTKF